LEFLESLVPRLQAWRQWYSKYYAREVFKQGQPGPSSLFLQNFKRGKIDWLTKVNRFANYRSKEIINHSFYLFLQQSDLSIPFQYRRPMITWEACFRSAAKYDKEQPTIDSSAWNLSYNFVYKHFHPTMGNSRVVSRDEALADMNMQSSVGFPANLHFHSKNEFFQQTKRPDIIDDYWDVIGGANVDHIVPIWSSTGKDELRNISKLQFFGAFADSIRTFTSSPIELSVAGNRMYVDQNQKFYDAAGSNGYWSFVGNTKFFRGWDNLYNRLNKHPNAFDLDESEFDSSLFKKAMEGQRDLRWDFLDPIYKTPENRRRHLAIYDSIINTVIVLETGELIQKDTGNPSGSPNTIVDNTMILKRIFAYAFIVLYRKQFGADPTYDFFMNNVEAALNGDDNTFTVSDLIVGWFNATTIAAVWSSIGITTKTDCWEARKLHEVTFLSHSFVFQDRTWLPQPDTQKVLCSLLYGSTLDDVRWHLMRAYALRIDSWPNVEARTIISQYINYLWRTERPALVGSVEFAKGEFMSMSQIQSLDKSDYELYLLYTCYENSNKDSSAELLDPNFFKKRNHDKLSFNYFRQFI